MSVLQGSPLKRKRAQWVALGYKSFTGHHKSKANMSGTLFYQDDKFLGALCFMYLS
jgi:hypothetical protein